MTTKKISLTIEENTFAEFKDFCKKNGMKISTRVELLIKRDLEVTGFIKSIKSKRVKQ